MASDSKKYYWLKLKKDFFKKHDITIIEDMEDGKEYILFYLKLLCESISHEGNLRFSEEIPYTEEMLSTITRTKKDIVSKALKTLADFKLIDTLDDKTIVVNEAKKMVGYETEWAKKKREYRENKEKIDEGQQEDNVLTQKGQCPIRDRVRDRVRDRDIYIKKGKTKFSPPSLKKVEDYCNERGNGIDAQNFIDFYESKGWYVGKNKMKDWKACVRTWEKRSNTNIDQEYKMARIKEINEKLKTNIEKTNEIFNKAEEFKKSIGIGVINGRDTSKKLNTTDKGLLPDTKNT